MKTRIISGAVGVVLLIITLIFRATLVLDIVMGLIALIASYEILNTTRTIKAIPFAVISAIYMVLSMFTVRGYIGISFTVITVIYTILFCICVLIEYEKTNTIADATILIDLL